MRQSNPGTSCENHTFAVHEQSKIKKTSVIVASHSNGRDLALQGDAVGDHWCGGVWWG